MNKYFSFFLLALVSLSCSSKQEAITAIENDLLPTFYVEGEKPDPASIEERMEHHNVPGISVAVFRNGKLDWAKGYE